MYHQSYKRNSNYKYVYWPTSKKIKFEFVAFVRGSGVKARECGRVRVMLPTSKGQDIIGWLFSGDFG